jgi:hypothetical protein
MPQARIDKLIDALRNVLVVLESTQPPEPTTALGQLARDAFGRLPSQVRAVLAVATAEGVEGTEVEVTARPLLESGITLGWVGRDEAKVVSLRDHMKHQHDLWMNEFIDAVNGRPLTRHFERDRFPGPRARAKAAGQFYAHAYAIGYPSMSAATHNLADGFMKAMQPGLIGVGNALGHAVIGAGLVVFWVGVVSGSDELRKKGMAIINTE